MKSGMENVCRTLPICSKCINYEISGWLNENKEKLSKDSKLGMREQLRSMKLKQGECIVCNHNSVTEGVAEKILDILNENEEVEKLKEDFAKSFCFNHPYISS